jgi:hypothetical protein
MNDFTKCAGCSCYREYPNDFLNEKGRLMKSCENCRDKNRKHYRKRQSGKGLKVNGYVKKKPLFSKRKVVDNIEESDDEADDNKSEMSFSSSCFNEYDKIENYVDDESEDEDLKSHNNNRFTADGYLCYDDKILINAKCQLTELERRGIIKKINGDYFDAMGAKELVIKKEDVEKLPIFPAVGSIDKIKILDEDGGSFVEYKL